MIYHVIHLLAVYTTVAILLIPLVASGHCTQGLMVMLDFMHDWCINVMKDLDFSGICFDGSAKDILILLFYP